MAPVSRNVLMVYQLISLLLGLLIKVKKMMQQQMVLLLIINESPCTRVKIKRRKRLQPRRFWVTTGRTDLWWQNLITGKTAESNWLKNFRMTKGDFLNLADILRPSLLHSFKGPRPGLSVEKQLAITLHYLKDPGTMTVTANAFGVATCTVSNTVKRVCLAINEHLGPTLLKTPTTVEEVELAVKNFQEKFGFPQVIGLVDGTHIPIKQPQENPHPYFSYKMKYTINAQAVCDHKGCFINVDIKWPGGTHDANVFAMSSINKALRDGEIPSVPKCLLPGKSDIPVMVIGDPAYPLLPYCMKEYQSCYHNKQVVFNTMLRSCRNQVECAFGRLKARWQILTRSMDVKLEDVPSTIYTCFILHNYCERNNIFLNEAAAQQQLLLAQEENSNINRRHSYNTSQGSIIRDILTDYFDEYCTYE